LDTHVKCVVSDGPTTPIRADVVIGKFAAGREMAEPSKTPFAERPELESAHVFSIVPMLAV